MMISGERHLQESYDHVSQKAIYMGSQSDLSHRGFERFSNLGSQLSKESMNDSVGKTVIFVVDWPFWSSFEWTIPLGNLRMTLWPSANIVFRGYDKLAWAVMKALRSS